MKRRLFLSLASATALVAAAPVAARAQTRPLPGAGLRGTRNAAEFGVLPSAAADQSAAFQAMLDTAATEKQALYLPGGMYLISDIRIPSGAMLEGVPGQTRLVHTGTGPFLSAGHANGIALRGLALEGGFDQDLGASDGLVDFYKVEAFTIEDCRFEGPGRNAVRLHECSGSLHNNTVVEAVLAAVFATDCTGLSITENSIENCGNGGIVIHRAAPGHDGTIVSGNRIHNTGATNGGTGQWGNAINFFRADNVIAANNVITASAFTAIRGNTVRNMQVTGNICRDSGETAIYAEFAFENAVISDNIVDGAANGISAPNLDHGGHGATISGNIVRNLHVIGPYEPAFPGFGTGIGVEADAVVTGNLVEGAPLYGINAGWGPFLRDVVISANTIRDARFGIGVSAADGAGRALIRGNLIAARNTGIQAHAWGEPVAPDLLVDPRRAPANVTASANLATSG